MLYKLMYKLSGRARHGLAYVLIRFPVLLFLLLVLALPGNGVFAQAPSPNIDITGLIVTHHVYGNGTAPEGTGYSGSASGNSVLVSTGSSVRGSNVYGAYGSGSVTGNWVTIENNGRVGYITGNDGSVYGGYSTGGAASDKE